MKEHDTLYGVGVMITIFGFAGIAEAITGNGSIIISAAVFGIGFACILRSYWK